MINIEELIPFMKKGWVAMDMNRKWFWYNKEPMATLECWLGNKADELCCLGAFDIAPVEDWKKSLRKVGR